jgi:hypothetical protein
MKSEPVIDKDKTSDELLKEALEYLDEVTFKFACFVDHFKRAVENKTKDIKTTKSI